MITQGAARRRTTPGLCDGLEMFSDGSTLRSISLPHRGSGFFRGETWPDLYSAGTERWIEHDLVKMILETTGQTHSLLRLDRPDCHDRRYAIESSFAQRGLNWKPHRNFKKASTKPFNGP